jgi:segregation and condensation protein A
MEFRVSIEQFDGPLDLMLHLIKENKLDIFDLDLSVLADQYIQFIHAMDSLHLEIASEYIVELASLVEYKSKKLLPRNEAAMQDNYEEDQRDKLVSRLMEYQKYKDAAALLEEMYEQRSHQLTRPQASVIDEWSVVQEVEDYSKLKTNDLYKAMNRVMKRFALSYPYPTHMEVKEISIEERMDEIMEQIVQWKDWHSFALLCADCDSLHKVIMTFLALLSCIHAGQIRYTIDEQETIWIAKGESLSGESVYSRD